jgi:hypothetical protein
MTNWRAMQAPIDKSKKLAAIAPHGVKPRYMKMGSWHANLSKNGARRNA